MSAIAGIFWKDGRPADQDALSRLVSGLRPLGQGGQQLHALGSAGLVRAFDSPRTASVFGDAPVIGGGGDLMLVFEGRLDNRDDLHAELGLDLVEAQGLPDSVIALKSWENWGAKAVEHWLGDFAAICWNAAERTLVAVRDPLGMRGLSYHDTPDRIVIASAPRAMFALPDVEKRVDEQKIADSLVQLYHDGERSFFKGIHRLPMASRLTVTAAEAGVDRYWSPEDLCAIRLGRDEEYVEAAAELLGRAIKARLRGSDRVGAFMSGGLDSSTVAVSALDQLERQDKLPTFTWVPEDGWDRRTRRGAYGDERPFVEAIAAMHPRLEPHFVQADGMGLFDHLDNFLDYAGVAPRNAINFCWIHEIYQRAGEQGIDVLLEGGAGNMSLSWAGDGLFLNLFRSGRFIELARELYK
ncbi:MAG: asparagine synthase-related protein, partial [Anderseniella sp.]|nr:asparagine synthase-related protein [Anderseniella sp.]